MIQTHWKTKAHSGLRIQQDVDEYRHPCFREILHLYNNNGYKSLSYVKKSHGQIAYI